MLNGDAMRFGSAASGGDAGAVVTTKIYGPFPVTFEDDIETGVDLFDPPEGSYILNAWVENVTTFTGNAISYDVAEMRTNGSDNDLFGGSGPNLQDLSDPSGDKLKLVGEWSILGALSSPLDKAPFRVAANTTMHLEAPIVSGGPPTSGEVHVFFLVAEVDS